MTFRALFFRMCLITVHGFLLLAEPCHGQWLVAHRGASHDAPENTLAAFQLAWERGADAIEGDFYVTRDQQIVCIHDGDTERTSGTKLIVAESTYQELSQLDVGSWKGPQYAGERIPTLKQVLACVPEGKRIFVEVKCGPEIVPLLKTEFAHCSLASDQIKIIAFDKDVIAVSKRELPEIEAFWLTSYKQNDQDQWLPTPDDVLRTLSDIQADGLDSQANQAVVTTSFASRLASANMGLHFWTVNDPHVASALRDLGAASITTDRPGYLRANMPRPNLMSYADVHLAFDGDLTDAADANRTITIVPEQTPIYGTGVVDQAIDLSAGDASLAVPYQLKDRGTLCLWYHAHQWYNYQTVFDNIVDRNAWELWIDESAKVHFRVHASGPSVQFQLHPTGDINEWHHLGVTWARGAGDQLSVQLFVNGQLCDDFPGERGVWAAPGEVLFLGGGNVGNTHGNGHWDDFLLFRDVLTPAEIRAVMFRQSR